MSRWCNLRKGLLLVITVSALVGCTKPKASKNQVESGKKTVEETKAADPSSVAGVRAGQLMFEEDFGSKDWRKNWSGSEKAWRVGDGKLKGQGDKNAGLWWTGELPQEAIIEFDAWAESQHGDLKVELYGEERVHQSGYVVILGGWKNRISIIARLDEHGADRIENRKKVATPLVKHHFKIVRRGSNLQWFVDAEQVLLLEDKMPLTGTSFGFANWEAPVAFDNLRIYDLQDESRK